ncbi:Type II restriction endonuclease [Weissella confusa]|uniref:DEAD/DEAH box helicase family protein n=1 Tax=Weissella confusa TaxID=1583 RepID=UPI000989A5FA|nr:DEAD/DEAH box helicase family protein [Weissella confusa]SJX68666.1 Type II restriction endonuclease [Weissella confusa]
MSITSIRTDTTNFDFLKLDWDLKEKYYNRAKYIEDFFVDGIYEKTVEQAEKFLKEDFLNVFNSYNRVKDKNEDIHMQALGVLKIIFNALVSVARNSGQTVEIEFKNPLPEELFTSMSRKIIYVQTADNSTGNWSVYDGSEKVGETSADLNRNPLDLLPNSEYLRKQADLRIDDYMGTAGVPHRVDWAELAYRDNDSQNPWFRDYDVHRVLEKSGYKKNTNIKGNEWWNITLDEAKKAIEAVKQNKEVIDGPVVNNQEIEFRPEQNDAVEATKKAFKKHNRMLWNAKMRFGKTLTAYKLVRDSGFNKVLILTHRPVVSDSWAEDFQKLNMKKEGYRFGWKKGRSIESLIKEQKNKFIYFASIQDLRESERVGGKYDKNAEIFDTEWDLVIFDEAHEGTRTDLAQKVENAVKKDKTKILELSGTPFNLLDKYAEDQVYTWDYVMEQAAKLKYSIENPHKKNPYEGLPKVNMFTFEMGQKEKYADDNKAFNFKEFFRVGDDGRFVHESDVQGFLNEISKPGNTNYPYSTEKFREELRHSLWLLPGVNEARALKTLMDEHEVFSNYTVVNVVDNNDNEEASQADLEKVRSAITQKPWETKTITLTVRKLTTGVNVKEWTAVMFLNNTTSAMNYLQAAFRAQTPYSNPVQGQKTNSYIFDFAPDRALTVMAESVSVNSGVGKRNTPEQKQKMAEMLNFLPIVGMADNSMEPFSVTRMLTQLKKVYAEKAVRSGFDDDSLYNDQLLTIDEKAAEMFKKLKGIVGKTELTKKPRDVTITNNGLTDEELEKLNKAKKKKKSELTEEEKLLREKLKKARKDRKNAISILRGISIRIPLLIFGMQIDPSEKVDIDTFVNEIDDVSWVEFMPEDVTKEMFMEQAKYYDSEVFIEAGRIIRTKAKSFDKLPFLDRVEEIAALHSTFKNPDKETVLTPWRVVNLQLASTFGGLSFWNEDYTSTYDDSGYPIRKWVQTDDTNEVYEPETRILELNSKTGLYPLFVAASLFQRRYEEINDGKVMAPMEEAIVRRILKNNIFVIAKTPMAKKITERTLAGYTDWDTNVQYIDGFTDRLKKDVQTGVRMSQEVFGKMKFDAVVGNPPYQDGAYQLYANFYKFAISVGLDVSLIFPTSWQQPKSKNGLGLLNTAEIKQDRQIVSIDNRENVFPGITGAKYTNIIHWKANYDNGLEGKQLVYTDGSNPVVTELPIDSALYGKPQELLDISKKVEAAKDFETISDYIYLQNKFDLGNVFNEFKYAKDKVASSGKEKRLRTNIFESLPEVFDLDSFPNAIEIMGLANRVRTTRYIRPEFLQDHPNLSKWKVLIPKAITDGFGERITDPIVVGPGIGYTETFLGFGAFESETEALNLKKYVKTKFARTLLAVLKMTQDTAPDKWGKVPMQNFTNKSDIDWDKSIPEIDEELFQKYDLSSDQKEFIRTKVKEMQ